MQGAPDTNIVSMPGKVLDQAPLAPSAEIVPPSDRWKGLAEPGTPVEQGLDLLHSGVADDQQCRIVRPHPAAVERAQLIYRHGLHGLLGADSGEGVGICMPLAIHQLGEQAGGDALRRSDRWGRLHRFGPYEQETGFTWGQIGR